MPDKTIISKVFWNIIQSSPFGVVTFCTCLFLENAAQVGLIAMMIYSDRDVKDQNIIGIKKSIGFDST
jgi:hypothetical protein